MKNILLRSILLSGCLIFAATQIPSVSCAEVISKNSPEQPYTQVRYIMGTIARIVVWSSDPMAAETAANVAFKKMSEIESLCSSWQPTSETSQITAKAGTVWHPVSSQVLELLSLARVISADSDGAFDPTILPLLQAWGLRGNTQPDTIPSAEQLSRTCGLVDWRDLEIDPAKKIVRLARSGMALDLGGIAKGYALDSATAVLRLAGITAATLDLGGNMRTLGAVSGNQVIIITPDGTDHEFGVLTMPSQLSSVATSGQYERYVEKKGRRFGHIIDPRDGWPVAWLGSVTVIANQGVIADALSTTIFVLGPKAGLQFAEKWKNCEALIIEPAGENTWQYSMTSGLVGRFEQVCPQ